ncbi:hypothetical protein [Dehalobacter sp. TeCB1]|uniref:hypothetical protein n=1 Tax=Dehalobacter sp. TeCB1 TaxID=1843715 RepID=UPI00083B2C97|nr:hypothetical protein [Dehalobacter sp. TeCB1]OCZ50859.1 hypothetical protein A7D23_14270 [Dehalobacter sp. TeCB1]
MAKKDFNVVAQDLLTNASLKVVSNKTQPVKDEQSEKEENEVITVSPSTEVTINEVTQKQPAQKPINKQEHRKKDDSPGQKVDAEINSFFAVKEKPVRVLKGFYIEEEVAKNLNEIKHRYNKDISDVANEAIKTFIRPIVESWNK